MSEAALLIDVDDAKCLAANDIARLALGLAGASQFPLALDSAMPAIGVLRAYARQSPKPQQRDVRVTMWLSGRPVTALCELSPIAASASAVVVKLLEISGGVSNDDAPAAHEPAQPLAAAANAETAKDPSPTRDGPQRPTNDDEEVEQAPPPERNDADTLKEIARRIRQGLAPEHGGTQLATDTSAAGEAAAHDAPAEIETEPKPAPDDASLPSAPGNTPRTDSNERDHAQRPPVRPPVAETLQRDARAKLAHELKTPLSAIVAASEIMRDERLGTMGNRQYLGYAADIHESATHALAVIGKMLGQAAAEPEASRRHRIDINELAMRTASSMDVLAAERELTLDLDLEDGLPRVIAAETAVRQILINLLANAFKFTPPGGDVRVVTGYLSNGAAFLVVRDTGDGMDEGTISDVFNDEPGRIAARRGGGYGIGLKLVRRLAREIGADIEIDSAPLKGTVVLVSFPKHLLVAA